MTFKAPLEIVANTHIQYSDSRLIRVELITEKVEYSSVRYYLRPKIVFTTKKVLGFSFAVF
jgi:hypothetical protein